MSNLSKAGIGMYVAIFITIIRGIFGVELEYNIVLDGAITLIQAIGFILWIIGQITRKDLNYGLFRKKQ